MDQRDEQQHVPETDGEITERLGRIEAQLADFHRRSAHRETIIDRLHAENQQFRDGLRRVVLEPVVTDLLRLYDSMAREAARLMPVDPQTARILGVAEPSSRIEVSLEDRPGELGRALQIIGERAGLNIVSVIVPSYRAQAAGKTAILHLATIDPREAIDALEAAGFPVGWPSLGRDLRVIEEAPRSR